MIVARLQGTDPVVRRALEDRLTLGRKTGLLRNLECPLPETFDRDLVKPRNRVLHPVEDRVEGVGMAECAAAIEVAATVVEIAFPLSVPAGFDQPLRRQW